MWPRLRRRTDPGLVRHFDGLAEMRHRLLEGAATERLLTGLAKPLDGGFTEACLDAVMRQQFRFALGDLHELALEGLGDKGMKRAPRLPQQRAVGSVLHQGMLE